MVEAKLNFQWRKLRLSNNFILPKLIGHRGIKNLKPENTLESINTAFDLGLECVEIDVKVSQDNIPLLLHDDTLDRTTTGSGLVCDFTFDQINQLDAGYFFYNAKTDIKVPSLRNVLDLIKNKPWIIMLVLTTLTFVSLAMKGGSYVYYFENYVDEARLTDFISPVLNFLSSIGINFFGNDPISAGFGLFNAGGIIFMIVGIGISKPLADSYGKRNISDFPPCGNMVIFVTEFVIFLKSNK